jgi:hypothetical protein
LFWLGEDGWPLAVPTWKSMFAAANARCADQGAGVSCHAHTLRHTFAVVTLEQLQRGHIAALAELSVIPRKKAVLPETMLRPSWSPCCLDRRGLG